MTRCLAHLGSLRCRLPVHAHGGHLWLGTDVADRHVDGGGGSDD